MARFRLGPGQRSGVYRAGQFVSRRYAARYPWKVVGWPPPPPEEEPREWEVTAVKRTRRNKKPLTVDLTFRVIPRAGVVATEESVRKAVWALVVHAREPEFYDVVGINWRNVYGRDRETEYTYEGKELWDAAADAKAVLRSVGMANLRVAPVED